MNTSKNFIPNKFVLLLFGLALVGFAAYGIHYSIQEKKKANEKQKQDNIVKVDFVKDKTLEKNKQQDKRLIDTDGDGVYDWIENLWPELDPNNPDSDGDGVSDAEYIKRKKAIREKDRLGAPVAESTLTESEKLGRSVYTALLAIEKSGGTIDEKTEEKISENIAKYVSDLSLGTKKYTRDQINGVPDTKENSYAYRKRMKKFFEENPVNTSEIELIINATSEPKKYALELQDAAMKYDAYVNELAKMKVPYLIAGRHTQLLNTAGQIEGALKNLTREESDEVVALSSLVQIEKTMNALVDVIVHIQKYFEIISDESLFPKELSAPKTEE